MKEQKKQVESYFFTPVRLVREVGQISIKNVLLWQTPLPTNVCQNMGISTFNMSQIMIHFLRHCCLFNIISIRPHMGLSAVTLDVKLWVLTHI